MQHCSQLLLLMALTLAALRIPSSTPLLHRQRPLFHALIWIRRYPALPITNNYCLGFKNLHDNPTMVQTRKRSRELLSSSPLSATSKPTFVKKFHNERTTRTTATNSDDNSTGDLSNFMEELLKGLPTTQTKSGWCLKKGLTHILSVDNGRMIPLVKQHGLPMIYKFIKKQKEEEQQTCRHQPPTAAATATARGQNKKDDGNSSSKNTVNKKTPSDGNNGDPKNCFQSLCRIVAGQQLAGAAAKTVWNRLLQTTNYNLTPQTVLELVGSYDNNKTSGNDNLQEQRLQKPAGLSRNKANSIVALARAFERKELSEEMLLSQKNHGNIREALLSIKGIGPWSCDMFQMFYLEHPDVFPVGDLGVRKGIAKWFRLKGHGKGGTLCPKKDLETMQEKMKVYQPYQSLATYYMWKVADTADFYNSSGGGAGHTVKEIASEGK